MKENGLLVLPIFYSIFPLLSMENSSIKVIHQSGKEGQIDNKEWYLGDPP